MDRIIACGLDLVDVSISGEEGIVRDEPDAAATSWSEVPIENAPYRDVSDHFVLWGEVALPRPTDLDPA